MTADELRFLKESELRRFQVVMLSLSEKIRHLAEDCLEATDLEEVVVPLSSILSVMQQDLEYRQQILEKLRQA